MPDVVATALHTNSTETAGQGLRLDASTGSERPRAAPLSAR
jgi:hypothetical protein